MSQRSKSVGFLILGIVLGSGALFIFVTPSLDQYEILKLDFFELEQENYAFLVSVSSLTDDLAELEEDFNDLDEDFDDLEDEYRAVQTMYINLNSDLAQLENENSVLNEELNDANKNWMSLSTNVLEFREELYSYCVLNESFPRIFSSNELDKIAAKVEEITRGDNDIWDGLNSIHKYVRDEVDYVYDSEVPVISTYRYYGDDDDPLLIDFETQYRQNMYQSLDFTVEYEQGDCDDQAMLEYAMIKYYQRYVLEEEYQLYLVYMGWEDSAHLTVFQPVQGDNICILDPAGQYQTGTTSSLTQNSIRDELMKYQNHWYDEYGAILELSFWIVDIDTGSYEESFSGSLEEAIAFFEDTI